MIITITLDNGYDINYKYDIILHCDLHSDVILHCGIIMHKLYRGISYLVFEENIYFQGPLHLKYLENNVLLLYIPHNYYF
jgi:hypothetical protein